MFTWFIYSSPAADNRRRDVTDDVSDDVSDDVTDDVTDDQTVVL